MNNKTVFLFRVFTLLTLFLCSAQQATAQTNPAISKMYGVVGLTNNYVDRGITQSNKSPSVATSLGYGFGELGRIALEANSVSYPHENASVEARLFGEYKFVFTPNADLRMRDDLIQYFNEGTRNRMQITFDQNFFGYHFLFSRDDNFEGTKTPRNWYAFHKDWMFGTDFGALMTIGYSMPQGYDAFWDALLGINYLWKNVTLTLSGTYVTSATQFHGLADPFVIFSLEARF